MKYKCISIYNCPLSKGIYDTYHFEASLSCENHFDEKVILIIIFQLGSIHVSFWYINYVIVFFRHLELFLHFRIHSVEIMIISLLNESLSIRV